MQDTMLRTRRLALRPLEISDWIPVCLMWQNKDVARYLWDGEAPNEERCVELIRSLVSDPPLHFMMLERETEVPVGLIGLLPSRYDAEKEIDFTIARSYWNCNLATEATCALLEYAQEDLHLDAVIAYIDPANHGSRRVLEKTGFEWVSRSEVRGRPLELLRHDLSRWH